MKKIKSKLFQEFKLESSEIVKIIGGVSINTTCTEDTTPVGGGYDKLFDTCNDGTSTIDNVKSDANSTTTLDKPNC
jgi:hypothetical protein